jgi:hypothetical protein
MDFGIFSIYVRVPRWIFEIVGIYDQIAGALIKCAGN